MNLEQIKEAKIKEAEELYLAIGLGLDNKPQESPVLYEFFFKDLNKGEESKKPKLIWTRLSINSNIGCIVE